MTLITEETLDNTLDNITALDEEGLSELFSDYFARQPFLMTYIMTTSESLANDAARNDLVFMLLLTMECFYSFDKTIPLITEEQIEEEENKQLEILEKFEKIESEEEQEEMAMSLVSSQVHLFEYLGDIMNGGEEDDSQSNFNDDDAGAAFGSMKLVADLLSRATDYK
jgi:hypothetical protein